MKFILLLTALAAGMLAPLQAGLNAKMGRAINDPVYAALISFAVLTFGLVVAGQLFMAVFMDHFGLIGLPVQSFSWQRLAGIILITAGVFLIRLY